MTRLLIILSMAALGFWWHDQQPEEGEGSFIWLENGTARLPVGKSGRVLRFDCPSQPELHWCEHHP